MRVRIGIRWWLAVAFAVVAATTAIAVAQLSSSRSEAAFRERAQALAAGSTFQAAIDLRGFRESGLREAAEVIADQRRLALFLFDDDGRLVSSPVSRGVPIERVPEYRRGVMTALRGERFVTTDESVRGTAVALPFAKGEARAIVAFASHPELAQQLGIVHDEITRSAWIALALGGLVGVCIASLIALRLGRIARAAAAIERGNFDKPLHARFYDEVGDLAQTFDRMRQRLRASFRQLSHERDRLEQLLERLQEGVVAVDRELRVQFANRTARWLIGAIPGDELRDLSPDVLIRDFAASLFDADGVRERRLELEGETVYLLIGVPAHGGETAVLVIRDVTEGERRERAEREFVSNASHELRTPLTTILGAVEVLQGGAKERAEDRDRFLAHIEREANRLLRLIRALLVLARFQTREELPRLSSVPIRPLLDEVAAATTPRPGVEVTVDCSDDIRVRGERDLLEQALVNLTANAAEHTRDGQIVLAADGDGDSGVRIEVRDSGPGIPRMARMRVFDRFYRSDRAAPGGFGLGLAIVAAAVRAQHGVLEVSDAPEGGARITMVLERDDEAP